MVFGACANSITARPPTPPTPQWNGETLVCHVSFPSHSTGSVANMRLLHRALGPWRVCCGWYPTCLSLPCNGGESNHLAAASSSSSLCVEIGLRPEEQGHINHKRILWGARSLSQLCQNNIQLSDVTLLYLRWTHPEPQTFKARISSDFWCFLANLSFTDFQHESKNKSFSSLPFIPQSLPPSHLPFLHIPHPLLPTPSPPSPSFFWLPVSLHAHLLPTIDNIPDGAPLLATHRQINQSNNTPINSNYALISPGRALLDVGKGCGSCRVIGCVLVQD